MNFISWAFFLLLIPALLGRFTIGRNRTEPAFYLLVMALSTIFVCWHVPIYILIMLVSLGVDYVAAIWIDQSPPQATFKRKWLLAASMTTNLLLLGFFKYTNFFLSEVRWLSSLVRTAPLAVPHLDLLLPMGISFYTFGSMSYTIDVYRGRMRPVRGFRDFYFFLTFFPHMVAGPIIRAEQFFYQLWRRRRPSLRVFNEGAYQIIRGLFLKMVCADNISGVVNAHWAAGYTPGAPSGRTAILAVLFAAQIFCDFEGYSSIARGLAYWMGFRFPINFNNPYIAGTFSNFWERWHITLSRWLRDYLYIPLGGNRLSRWRTYANLLIVMLLGGLWHGAAMTFVAWGALHGASLAVERLTGLNDPRRRPAPVVFRFGWAILVQIVVLITWILFRSETLSGALQFTRNALAFHRGPLERDVAIACLFIVPVLLMHAFGAIVERGWAPPLSRLNQAALAAVMLVAVLSAYGQSNEFIYFAF